MLEEGGRIWRSNFFFFNVGHMHFFYSRISDVKNCFGHECFLVGLVWDLEEGDAAFENNLDRCYL